jgi:NADH-quinone oxidoreductase subunit M
VFYGEQNSLTAVPLTLGWYEKAALGAIVIIVIGLGIYPQAMLNLTNDISDSILKNSDITPLLKRP